MPRNLIVNADDFGLSEGINRGIIEACRHGILTSASLMVRQPGAPAAGACARAGCPLSIGLHLDLAEWIFRDNDWVPLYTVVPTDDAAAVAKEVSRQLQEFRRLVGREPTHIDSHQHVHRQEPVRSIVRDLAAAICVPVRECTLGIQHCGDFYGQTGEGEPLNDVLTVEGLKRILESLPEGVTELGCHPGYPEGLTSVYREERQKELEVLCAPEIRMALSDLKIQLCSFEGIERLVPQQAWLSP